MNIMMGSEAAGRLAWGWAVAESSHLIHRGHSHSNCHSILTMLVLFLLL